MCEGHVCIYIYVYLNMPLSFALNRQTAVSLFDMFGVVLQGNQKEHHHFGGPNKIIKVPKLSAVDHAHGPKHDSLP